MEATTNTTLQAGNETLTIALPVGAEVEITAILGETIEFRAAGDLTAYGILHTADDLIGYAGRDDLSLSE